MLHPVQIRLGALGILVLSATGLIGWSAHVDARRSSELYDGLQLAQRFEESILTLHTQLNELAAGTNDGDARPLVETSRAVEAWIDAKRQEPHTVRQQRMLERMAASFASYVRRLESLAAKPAASDIERLERTIALEEHLAVILRESLAEFLAEVREGLRVRQTLTFGLLVSLLLLLAWLAFAVYRGMIAPLRARLVEADTAVEQSQKLAALGVLAAGIAHEIRNPLTAIKARLFTHRKGLTPGTAAYENTEFIGREIDRLERIVREFLLFARPAEPRLEPISTTALLREVQDLLGEELARSAIELQLAEGPEVQVQGDRQHLLQVLINLVHNAAESIGNNGRVVLRTREDRAPLRGIPTRVAVLEVEDTGRGIPPEMQARLFDPFFTTKPNGTGLGLSIAARIVEKHGGALRFQTQLNHGTTFGILLPLETVTGSPDPAPIEHAHLSAGG